MIQSGTPGGATDSFARRGDSEDRATLRLVLRSVMSEHRGFCGRERSRHDRSHGIIQVYVG